AGLICEGHRFLNVRIDAGVLAVLPVGRKAGKAEHRQRDITRAFRWQKVAVMDTAKPWHQVEPHCSVGFEVGELAQFDLIAQVTGSHRRCSEPTLNEMSRAISRTASPRPPWGDPSQLIWSACQARFLLLRKYFSSVFRKIMIIVAPSRLDKRGVRPIVTRRGARDAMDALGRKTCGITRTAKACGPGALEAGAKPCETFRTVTVTQKPVSPGRARYRPLTPLRRECRLIRPNLW